MGLLDYFDEDTPLIGGLFGGANSSRPVPPTNMPERDGTATPEPPPIADGVSPGPMMQAQASPALPQWLRTTQDPSRSTPPIAGPTQARFNERFNAGDRGLNRPENGPQIVLQFKPSRFDDAQFVDRNYAGVGGPPSQLQQEAAAYNNVKTKGFGKIERPSVESMSLAQTLVPYFVAAESEGDPTAKNKGSTATGTGQFLKGTWLDLYSDYLGLDGGGKAPRSSRRLDPSKDRPLLAERTDPQRSHQMLLLNTGKNIDRLKHEGFEPTRRNTYLAHFLGPDGAIAALSADPSSLVSQVLGKEAIRVNPPLQGDGRTIQQVIDWADQYLSEKGQGVDRRNKNNGYRLAPAAPIAFPNMPSQFMPARDGTIDLSKLQNTLKTSGNPIIFLGR